MFYLFDVAAFCCLYCLIGLAWYGIFRWLAQRLDLLTITAEDFGLGGDFADSWVWIIFWPVWAPSYIAIHLVVYLLALGALCIIIIACEFRHPPRGMVA